MTAEIAVLNKLAVTLAADSAVTIGVGGAQKVYNSADKIFEITNHDPIGLMVYNNPEVQGIPIEVIAKRYRDTVCKNKSSTVFKFSEDFLSHLENLSAPENTIAENIVFSVTPLFEQIKMQRADEFGRIVDALRSLPEDAQDFTPEKLAKVFLDADLKLVSSHIDRLSSSTGHDWCVDISEDHVIAAHDAHINDAIKIVFDETVFPDEVIKLLVRAGSLCLIHEYIPERLTGLVFAGFGEDEIFPSLVSYEIYGVVAGKLKYKQTRKFDVDRALYPISTVLPFAQKEMVDRFIYGLDNQFLQLCVDFFEGSLNSLAERLEESLQDLDGDTTGTIVGALGAASAAIMDEFRDTLVPQHLKSSKEQLSDIIRSMPKQELAALSESLVNITSLKRKFSADAESVGGPIDVAMITRAEGFVWVKRKHFFEARLNPRYFHRRYGSANQTVSNAYTEETEA
ncbi:hypothetical protein [Blastomonas aquatica]|uniref:Uncharacterized protein n=1 Tax=Blastomonas aquatica TaxID=1510276 RepID=A0ABQ1J1A1_9SPHN|nr:hypothetical protein [Blastomonas aquatica]GGB56396.1 hypothetical protein GCM10010833_08870 [Blastomonas aquatica]